jgi:mannose-6-phosphate isomerase-like protein (cupin superfamily)
VVDLSRAPENWKARGFSCDVWSDGPGQVWADFVHATDELVMLIEGELEVELNGSTFRPPPGEEILIPAGVVHTVRNLGLAPNRWYYGYRRR